MTDKRAVRSLSKLLLKEFPDPSDSGNVWGSPDEIAEAVLDSKFVTGSKPGGSKPSSRIVEVSESNDELGLVVERIAAEIVARKPGVAERYEGFAPITVIAMELNSYLPRYPGGARVKSEMPRLDKHGEVI